jgi:cyanophycinase
MSIHPSVAAIGAGDVELHQPPSTKRDGRGSSRAVAIAIGGAEDKEGDKTILRDFWQRAGGEHSDIVVIPAASGIPETIGPVYRNLFIEMGTAADAVRVLDIRNPFDACNPAALELVKHSTGIYFTGGDQERLAEVLGGTELMQQLRQRWLQGKTTVAGTSAGASALGHQMIARGYSGESPTPGIVTVKAGLGFLAGVIVDQHFHNRNRLIRLLTAVAHRPDCIGIDEDTAAAIGPDDTLEVIGAGTVTIVDGRTLRSNVTEVDLDRPFNLHDVKLHLLAAGSRFCLTTRAVV